jgi:hypothetical protein
MRTGAHITPLAVLRNTSGLATRAPSTLTKMLGVDDDLRTLAPESMDEITLIQRALQLAVP